MRLEPIGRLALGLGTGVAFGTLLQKGQVGKYDVILDQLLLRDGRVLDVMGTAVAVGSLGVHALAQTGHAELQVKPLRLGAIVPGAVAVRHRAGVARLLPRDDVNGSGRRSARRHGRRLGHAHGRDALRPRLPATEAASRGGRSREGHAADGDEDVSVALGGRTGCSDLACHDYPTEGSLYLTRSIVIAVLVLTAAALYVDAGPNCEASSSGRAPGDAAVGTLEWHLRK